MFEVNKKKKRRKTHLPDVVAPQSEGAQLVDFCFSALTSAPISFMMFIYLHDLSFSHVM